MRLTSRGKGRYTQALFFLGLASYVWVFPVSDVFEKTWADAFMDTAGISCLVAGELLRIWAVSHAGKSTRSRHLKAPMLVTTGPYACFRHPIYLGNFLIGLGMVSISDAYQFIPVFLLLFALQYRALITREEKFLAGRFGAKYHRYRRSVPKWIPSRKRVAKSLSLGPYFVRKELGTAWGIVLGAGFFEWIESAIHRSWLLAVFQWLFIGIGGGA